MSIDVDSFCLDCSKQLSEQLRAHDIALGTGHMLSGESLDFQLIGRALERALDDDDELRAMHSLAVLSKCGVDWNSKSKFDVGAVSMAISCDAYAACFFLIGVGANLDDRDDEGGTPILDFVKQQVGKPLDAGGARLLQCLTTESTDETRNGEGLEAGLTPLGIAVHGLDYDVTRVLIESGCDVNAGDFHGFTPLDVLDIHKVQSDARTRIEGLLVSRGGRRAKLR